MRLRLFTLLLFACLTLMVVKSVNLIDNRHSIAQLILAPDLAAEEKEGEAAKEAEKPADAEKKAEPAEGEEAAKEGEKEEGEKKAEKKPGEPMTAEEMIAADKKLSTERPQTAEQKFTKSEIDILERLSIRRQQLDDWEKEMVVKENMLNLSQARLQEKIEELRALKTEVETKLAEYNTKEDEKTKSLVKIYESMKPKDAARIFSEMEMETLLTVVENMKEKIAAPIIAKMDPVKAKKLTEEFAARGKLPEALKQQPQTN